MAGETYQLQYSSTMSRQIGLMSAAQP